jgi:hypothetical protein
MSKINAKKLVEKLSKNKKFKEEFIAEEMAVVLNFAKKAGLKCSAEELQEVSGGVTDDFFKWLYSLGDSSRGNPTRWPK